LDGVVLWALLPDEVRERTRPAAAKDYWGRGRFRRYVATDILNAILIEREHVSKEANPLEEILNGMGNRYSLIVFPEGTRNPGPEVGPFRSGLYHLARHRPDVELVPVYIDNMNRILPKGEYLPVPLLSRVAFGPALHLQEHESKASFLERAREAVVRLRDL
jgi:1-acyl-sn-glycerol-3-phosphate acyltransferase